ncbi:GNAT family N-acetyltransferase [Phytomonospora sp. NPDC050363]|uniref:GNAT family N-acetyltransferase n=1 Tax=Phytomonospora sp. NPDC050363 TaxID=3155642 RepID=UPI0033E074AB
MIVSWEEPGGPGHVHTARLCLRRPRGEDALAHHEIHSDPATNLHNPAGPTLDPAANAADLASWRADWARDGIGYWMVRETCDGEVAGVGGVRRAAFDVPVLNLYYRFRPSAWGRGYAGEVAGAGVEAARAFAPGLPVVAVLRPGNTASRRVAERAGLVFSRVLDKDGRPSELYVLDPPDPSPAFHRRPEPPGP